MILTNIGQDAILYLEMNYQDVSKKFPNPNLCSTGPNKDWFDNKCSSLGALGWPDFFQKLPPLNFRAFFYPYHQVWKNGDSYDFRKSYSSMYLLTKQSTAYLIFLEKSFFFHNQNCFILRPKNQILLFYYSKWIFVYCATKSQKYDFGYVRLSNHCGLSPLYWRTKCSVTKPHYIRVTDSKI